jgi:homoserine kinase type II
MFHLHKHGLPVATPIATLDGMTTTIFCGKPATFFTKLPGRHVLEPGIDHCQAIGQVLANLHTIPLPGTGSRNYEFDLSWFKTCKDQLRNYFDADNRDLLEGVVEEYSTLLNQHGKFLPTSIIHGDLFRDNALFLHSQVTGLIDFYHAGIGHLVLDLAITINDWCHDKELLFRPDLYRSLLNGYQKIRPLTQLETLLLPVFLRVAATKFWLRRAQLTFEADERKDPNEFRRILLGWMTEDRNLATQEIV